MARVIRVPFDTRVARENFLPPRLVIPVALAIMVMTVLGSLESPDLRLGLTWAAIHLATISVAGVVLVLAKAMVMASKARTVSLGVMLPTAVVAGATKAVTTAAAEQYFELTDQWADNIGPRLVGATIAAVWLVVFTAYAETGLQRLAKARDELVQANVQTRLQTGHPAPALELELELDGTISQMRTLRKQVQPTGTMLPSSTIRDVVDNTIRPLSKSLYSTENARYPSISLSSFLEASLKSGRMPAGWIALLWGATSFPPIAVSAGIVQGLIHTASLGLLAYLTWRVAARLMPKNHAGSLAFIGALSMGIVFIGPMITTQLLPGLDRVLNPVNIMVGAVWMFLAATGLSILSGALNIARLIRHDLETRDTKTLIDQQSRDLSSMWAQRNLAATLHGEIQSRLLGIATAIDHHRLSPKALQSELDAVIVSLERLNAERNSELNEHAQQSAAERLQGLHGLWQGLLSVEIEPDSEKSLIRAINASPDIIEIIREALANAHRHGGATSVTIAFRGNDKQATLTVTDNGYGPRNGPPGLGTELLNSWSKNRWKLIDVHDGGAKLQVTLDSTTSHTGRNPTLR